MHLEQTYRLAIERLADYAIFVIDPRGRMATWNAGVRQVLGYEEGEFIGQSFSILFPPEDRPHVPDAELQRAREQGRAEEDRWQIKNDGSRFWASGVTTAVRDEEGRLSGFLKVMRDQTQRRLAESAGRESEERFRALVTATSDVVYCMSPDWSEMRYLEGRQFIADTREPSRTWLEKYIHPDDRPVVMETINRAIRTRSAFELEHRVLRVDGTPGWTFSRAIPILDSRGEIVEWFGAASDVTRRKLAEATARESEQRLQTFIRTCPAAVAMLDCDMRYVVASNRWVEDYQLAGDELIGRSHYEVFPEIPQRWKEIHRRCLAGKTQRSDEDQFVRADGSVQWLRWEILPWRDPRGQIGGIIIFSEDVTARKRAEAEREQLLQSERAARTEAEKANRIKDEFLATLSHELRTPLNAIVGWSQVLKVGKSSEQELAEGLAVIGRNARVQTRIIEDLLDMSRILSGKVRLDVQRVDLADVLSSAVESVKPSADAKGIHVHQVLDSSDLWLKGDPNRLQQVAWNLLSNAIKFTPRGGRIQVLLERVNSHARIIVSDTGIGIKPEFLPHVFDRFRQADASTTRKQGGLGLGLSIVKQLVEMHGGTVRANSGGENKGSTFIVTLPLPIVHEDDAPRGEDDAAPLAPTEAQREQLKLNGIRVLMVDDEPDAQTLVKRILQDCGAEVMTAGSAGEAMDVIRRGGLNILVSDIGMPGRDGFDLVREVRALPPEKGGMVPAVALTAFARSEDRRHAMMAGFDMHVAKPVEPDELCAVVARLAGRVGR